MVSLPKIRLFGLAFLLCFSGLWVTVMFHLHRGRTGNIVDDGIYLVSAQALRDGKGFTLPSRPGSPPCPRYPIGFPFLISIVLRMEPGAPSLVRDAALAKGLVIACAGVFLSASYLVLRRLHVRNWLALLTVLITACHPELLNSYYTIMSDAPFAALLTLASLGWIGRRKRPGFLNGLAIAATWLIRTNGITVIIGTLTAWLLSRPRTVRRLLAIATGFLVLAGPLEWYTIHYASVVSPIYRNNLAQTWSSFASFSHIVGGNLNEMVDSSVRLMFPVLFFTHPLAQFLARNPAAMWPLRIVVAGLVIFGLVRLLRVFEKRLLPLWINAALTLVIYATHNWGFGTRYVLFLTPFFLLAFTTGLAKFVHQRVATAVLVLVLISSLVLTGRVALRARQQDGFVGDPSDIEGMEQTLGFIRSNLPSQAVICSLTPELVYLHTGRQAAPLISDEAWMRRQFNRNELDYWMQSAPGRPFYLLTSAPDPNGNVDAAQTAALFGDPTLNVQGVFHSSNSRFILSAVSRKTGF